MTTVYALVEYRGTSRDEQPEIYLLIGSASCKKATTFPAWTTARPLRVAAMARTKKARADNPKHDTADSRRQLKRTKLELLSRSKQDRPKKSGRVSFDYETDPPQERPPSSLTARRGRGASRARPAMTPRRARAFSVRATCAWLRDPARHAPAGSRQPRFSQHPPLRAPAPACRLPRGSHGRLRWRSDPPPRSRSATIDDARVRRAHGRRDKPPPAAVEGHGLKTTRQGSRLTPRRAATRKKGSRKGRQPETQAKGRRLDEDSRGREDGDARLFRGGCQQSRCS